MPTVERDRRQSDLSAWNGWCFPALCPVCGRDFRTSWAGLRARWPRWLAVFLASCLAWAIWQSAEASAIGARGVRLLYGGGAALAWIVTLSLWFFLDVGRDAEHHKACLPRTWRMWLAPPLLGLALALGALVAGAAAYAAVSALQYLRH